VRKKKELLHEIFEPEDVMRRSGIDVISPQRKISRFGKFKEFVNTTNARMGEIGSRIEGLEKKKSKKTRNPFESW
jgi:hypothetical protein